MKKLTLNLCYALVTAALAQSAQAQFTYTGGNLNSAQTYDGTGVDSGLNPYAIGNSSANDYIGTGSGGNGSITMSSGTLTINASDFKVANGSGSTGNLNVNGGTLNINQIGLWGGGAGMGGNGTISIASGATVNWQTSGSTEQRFMFGNGTGGVGILNLNGGSLYNFFDSAQALTDAERQFRAGSDGGIATINLNAGLWSLNGAVPFFLGGKYNNMNGTAGIVQGASVSIMNIANGVFQQTGITIGTGFSATESTFTVGANDLINFSSTGTGSLSLQGWTSSDYLNLATSGKLEVDGSVVSDLNLFSYQSVGGQGVLGITAVPEPSPLALFGAGILGLVSVIRRRK